MSAEEADKTITPAEPPVGDEEEEWLYGGETHIIYTLSYNTQTHTYNL